MGSDGDSDTDSEDSQAGNPYNFAYGDKYIDERIRPFIPQSWHGMNFHATARKRLDELSL